MVARCALTGLTALLLLAWGLSGWWALQWAGFLGSTYHSGQSAGGVVQISVARPLGDVGWVLGWDIKRRRPVAGNSQPSPYAVAGVYPPPAIDRRWSWWGKWPTSTRSGDFRRDEITIPVWMLVLPLAIAATSTWISAFAAGRRGRAGLCSSCGYDRRSITAGLPCPECGTTTATTAR